MVHFANDVEICYPHSSAAPDKLAAQILIVDDNPDLLQLLREVLEEVGYDITTAGDGRAALNLAQNSSVPLDLVITDINMPRMNGIELARRLKTLRPETPVIFVSACAGSFLTSELGPDTHFIPKPFMHTALLEKISTVLSTRQFSS